MYVALLGKLRSRAVQAVLTHGDQIGELETVCGPLANQIIARTEHQMMELVGSREILDASVLQ